MQAITRWGSAFELRNTEGYRSSQAEIVALSGSSKAESGTEPRFTPTRRPRSCSSSPSIAVIGTIADQPVGGAVEEARAMSAMRKTSSASCASDASASCWGIS